MQHAAAPARLYADAQGAVAAQQGPPLGGDAGEDDWPRREQELRHAAERRLGGQAQLPQLWAKVRVLHLRRHATDDQSWRRLKSLRAWSTNWHAVYAKPSEVRPSEVW